MTGRIRITREDRRELWIQSTDSGFALTMFDEMDRSIAIEITKAEASAVSEYLLETVPFSERVPGNLLSLVSNDAEAEIRRVFKERMGTENGWSDALSDVLDIVRRSFDGIAGGGRP